MDGPVLGRIRYGKMLRVASDIAGYEPETDTRYRPAGLAGESEDIERLEWASRWLGRHFESAHQMELRILGSVAVAIHRLKKDYFYQFLIKASNRRVLRELLIGCREFAQRENFPAVSLIIDVDPQLLL